MGRSQIPREVWCLAKWPQRRSADGANTKSIIVDQISSNRMGQEQAKSCWTTYRLEIAPEGAGWEFCRRWVSANHSSPASTVRAPCAAARIAGDGITGKAGARGFVHDVERGMAFLW